jgi:hypothetical protein
MRASRSTRKIAWLIGPPSAAAGTGTAVDALSAGGVLCLAMPLPLRDLRIYCLTSLTASTLL